MVAELAQRSAQEQVVQTGAGLGQAFGVREGVLLGLGLAVGLRLEHVAGFGRDEGG